MAANKPLLIIALIMPLLVIWLIKPRHTDYSDNIEIANTQLSPDRRYKAVVMYESGGEMAFSSWCVDYVAVVPTGIGNTEATMDKYRVYVGGCHELSFSQAANRHTARMNAPLVKWRDANTLEITIDERLAKEGINPSSYKFNAANSDGTIKLIRGKYEEPTWKKQ